MDLGPILCVCFRRGTCFVAHPGPEAYGLPPNMALVGNGFGGKVEVTVHLPSAFSRQTPQERVFAAEKIARHILMLRHPDNIPVGEYVLVPLPGSSGAEPVAWPMGEDLRSDTADAALTAALLAAEPPLKYSVPTAETKGPRGLLSSLEVLIERAPVPTAETEGPRGLLLDTDACWKVVSRWRHYGSVGDAVIAGVLEHEAQLAAIADMLQREVQDAGPTFAEIADGSTLQIDSSWNPGVPGRASAELILALASLASSDRRLVQVRVRKALGMGSIICYGPDPVTWKAEVLELSAFSAVAKLCREWFAWGVPVATDHRRGRVRIFLLMPGGVRRSLLLGDDAPLPDLEQLVAHRGPRGFDPKPLIAQLRRAAEPGWPAWEWFDSDRGNEGELQLSPDLVEHNLALLIRVILEARDLGTAQGRIQWLRVLCHTVILEYACPTTPIVGSETTSSADLIRDTHVVTALRRLLEVHQAAARIVDRRPASDLPLLVGRGGLALVCGATSLGAFLALVTASALAAFAAGVTGMLAGWVLSGSIARGLAVRALRSRIDELQIERLSLPVLDQRLKDVRAVLSAARASSAPPTPPTEAD